MHESFQAREKTDYTEQAVHCVNVEVKDNHEDALVGALDAVKLAAALKQLCHQRHHLQRQQGQQRQRQRQRQHQLRRLRSARCA